LSTLRLNGYGLIIGVGTYDDSSLNIPIAERDALGIFDALTSPESGHDRANFSLLSGRDASRPGIISAMDALSRRAEPDSTVIISYTGHGGHDSRGMYCLATSDTRLSKDRSTVEDSHAAYRISDLAAALNGLRARRVLVIINSCGAGNIAMIAQQRRPQEAMNSEQADDLVGGGQGRVLILASRPEELSYFLPDAPYSVAGQALISGLRGVTTVPRGGYIGIFEWYESVYTQVSASSMAHSQPQHPRLIVIDGEGAFPVVRHPHANGADDRSAMLQSAPPMPDVSRVSFRAGMIGTAIGRDSVINQTADIPPVLSRMVDDQREAMLRLVDVVLRQGDELRTSFAHIQAEVRDSIQRVRDEVTIYRTMSDQSVKAWREKEEELRRQRQYEVDRRDRRVIYSLLALMAMVVVLIAVLLIVG
jgi:hypothetical protein